MNKKIVVLGCKGMLGQMVMHYFSSRYDTIAETARYDFSSPNSFLDALRKHRNAVFINCIGKIKQKSDSASELFGANTILPIELAQSLLPSQHLIHASTDCVYHGRKVEKWNPLGSRFNADDLYGRSKAISDQVLTNLPRVHVVRVSIIGPDASCPSPAGLMGWFLSQPPRTEVLGYTNHFWNGITTLEWCKLVDKHILQRKLDETTKTNLQAGTDGIHSKEQILRYINEVFACAVTIKSFAHADEVNRALEPEIVCSPLPKQIEELLNFVQYSRFPILYGKK